MGDFKMGSKTIMSQSGTSNPTWGANAPTGAVLRTFYNESDAVPQGLSTAAGILYWDELNLDIPASSTSDYLIIMLTLNSIMTEDATAYLDIGFAYSVDDWTNKIQLGTTEYYNKHGYNAAANLEVTSSSVTIRVNHPTTSAYKIRPKLHASNKTVEFNWGSTRSTILAMEVKG